MRSGFRIFKIVFCFLFIFTILTGDSYGQSYGLAFSSHEVFQDKRTSLDLSPDKTLCFKDNFDISFDLSFIPNHIIYFGYIVRIIEDDNRNIDLVYNAQANKKHFNIIVGDRLTNIAFDIDKLFDQWNHLRIKFDTEHDRIILYSGKAIYTATGLHLKKNSCYKILFGINNYKQFQTTDIPPMKIRDIKITENDQLKYNWPLNEISGQVAHEGYGPKGKGLTFMLKDKKVHFSIDAIDIDRFYEKSDNPVPDDHYNYQKDILEYFTAEDITGIEVLYNPQYTALYNDKNLPALYDDQNLPTATMPGSGSDLTAYIEITTRSGQGPYANSPKGIYVYRPAPVIIPAQFYTPRYPVKNMYPGFTDLRSTIHWEPNIVTNKNGEANTFFYAADPLTTYTLILQGADLNGSVGYTTQEITITNKKQ